MQNFNFKAQATLDYSVFVTQAKISNIDESLKEFSGNNKEYYLFIRETLEITVDVNSSLTSELIISFNEEWDANIINSSQIYNSEIIRYTYIIENSANFIGNVVANFNVGDYYDAITLHYVDTITSIALDINQIVPMAGDEIIFDVIINGETELKTSDFEFAWQITNDNLNFRTNGNDGNELTDFIFNNNQTIFNTSENEELTDFIITYTLNYNSKNYNCSFDFNLNEKIDVTSIHLLKQSVNLISSDENAYINVYINSGAKPNFDILDTLNAITLNNITKITSDKADFDEYTLNVGVDDSSSHSILIRVKINDEEDAQNLFVSCYINIINSVESITIYSDDNTYASNEPFSVYAKINGLDDVNTKILWKIDDELLNYETSEITLSYSEGQTLNFQASVMNLTSDIYSIEITHTTWDIIIWLIILIISIGAMILIYILDKNKVHKTNEALLDSCQEIIDVWAKFKDNKTRAFNKKTLIQVGYLKEKSFFELDDSPDTLYENAYEEIYKAYNILKKNMSKKKQGLDYNSAYDLIDKKFKRAYAYVKEYYKVTHKINKSN